MFIKFIKKHKIIVIFSIIAVIFAISLIFELIRPYQHWNFVDNGRNEPYAKGVPLDEMNLWIYENRYIYNRVTTVLGYPDLVKNISLPCDIHYYAKKEDAEPVFTLKKGTIMHITDEFNLLHVNGAGYGLMCWPDYQKGWRYGRPFTDGETLQLADVAQGYYVKTAELDKVADAFFNQFPNKDYYKKYYNDGRSLVREIDWILYDAGAFCSPDLP